MLEQNLKKKNYKLAQDVNSFNPMRPINKQTKGNHNKPQEQENKSQKKK